MCILYAAPSWESEELQLKSEVGRARVEVRRTRVEVGRARVEVGREKRVTLLGHGSTHIYMYVCLTYSL